MPRLFWDRNLTLLLVGAVAAAAVGMLLGGSLQPNLREGESTGPRTLIAGGGTRETPAAADPGVTVYPGHVPDYVLGSDRITSLEPELEPAGDFETYMAATGDEVANNADPADLVRTPEPHLGRQAPAAYPSHTGGMVHESDLPSPPAPPEESDPG